MVTYLYFEIDTDTIVSTHCMTYTVCTNSRVDKSAVKTRAYTVSLCSVIVYRQCVERVCEVLITLLSLSVKLIISLSM